MSATFFCKTSERSLVGCIIASKGDALDAIEATPEHFVDGLSNLLVSTALDLRREGRPVDSFTVLQRAEPEVLKIATIHEAAEMCRHPSPALAKHFFEIVNEKLIRRRAYELSKWAVATIEQTDDITGFCANLCARAASLDARHECENVLGAALDEMNERLSRFERKERIIGHQTPFAVWNKAFGGISKGNLYALAARPGMGKTAMMEQMVYSLSGDMKPVLIFEKDMSPQILVERIACRVCQVPFWRYMRGIVDEEDILALRETIEEIRELPIYLYNPTNLTAEKLSAIARREARTHGIQAVFLDHIQVLSVGKDLREGLTRASIVLRTLVNETGVPLIALAHINRTGAKGRPSTEDIKEFDQLHGDCDGMAILWTEENRAKLKAGEFLKMKFFAAKNRNGPVGEEGILFDGELMQFRDQADERRNGA